MEPGRKGETRAEQSSPLAPKHNMGVAAEHAYYTGETRDGNSCGQNSSGGSSRAWGQCEPRAREVRAQWGRADTTELEPEWCREEKGVAGSCCAPLVLWRGDNHSAKQLGSEPSPASSPGGAGIGVAEATGPRPRAFASLLVTKMVGAWRILLSVSLAALTEALALPLPKHRG